MKHRVKSRSSLAYLDEEFLESDAARPVRILAEYLAPLETFRRERIHDTIVFFGSARLSPDGPLGRYYEEARTLARLVTTWSKGLPSGSHRYVVCSGGGPGSWRPRTAAPRRPPAARWGSTSGSPTSSGPTPGSPAS